MENFSKQLMDLLHSIYNYIFLFITNNGILIDDGNIKIYKLKIKHHTIKYINLKIFNNIEEIEFENENGSFINFWEMEIDVLTDIADKLIEIKIN